MILHPPTSGDDRAVRYQAVVLRALESLSAGDDRPKTLHRLRTHLRRLQAYLELVGEASNARIIAKCVSRLSQLRTLQVLERHLTSLKAQRSDLRLVRKRIRARQAKLQRTDVYRKIERRVQQHAIPPTPGNQDWMRERMFDLRRANGQALSALIAAAQAKPRRKRLHALRLKIKSIRYQEEWALGTQEERPDLVGWLKHAQSVLGEYEERTQFRWLADKLGLQSFPRIEQDWRAARKKARALPDHLADLAGTIEPRSLRLIGSNRTKPLAVASRQG
jgi:CHAD domain-containing protein